MPNKNIPSSVAEMAASIAEKRIIEPTSELVEKYAKALEANGWTRAVAGEANFTKAARAWAYANLNRLGLLVMGNVGTGKTALIKAITRNRPAFYAFYLKDPRSVTFLNARMYGEWLMHDCMKKNIIMDDLGAEQASNEFGERHEYAAEFLMNYCYHGWGRLYITTNLEWHDIIDRYNDRVDCLREHVTPLILEGESVRSWYVPKK